MQSSSMSLSFFLGLSSLMFYVRVEHDGHGSSRRRVLMWTVTLYRGFSVIVVPESHGSLRVDTIGFGFRFQYCGHIVGMHGFFEGMLNTAKLLAGDIIVGITRIYIVWNVTFFDNMPGRLARY